MPEKRFQIVQNAGRVSGSVHNGKGAAKQFLPSVVQGFSSNGLVGCVVALRPGDEISMSCVHVPAGVDAGSEPASLPSLEAVDPNGRVRLNAHGGIEPGNKGIAPSAKRSADNAALMRVNALDDHRQALFPWPFASEGGIGWEPVAVVHIDEVAVVGFAYRFPQGSRSRARGSEDVQDLAHGCVLRPIRLVSSMSTVYGNFGCWEGRAALSP